MSFLVVGFVCVAGCQHTPSDSTPSSSPQTVTTVPADLQETVTTLAHAVETIDIPTILAAYAEDFLSGAGRSKDGVREVFTQLKEKNVKLQVEKTTVEKVDGDEALLRTQLRLRYIDHFRDLGEGEVIVTDVLRNSLRREKTGWKIYADERLSTYREGRYGSQAPNVQLEVPEQLPVDLEYPVTVTVHRDREIEYQVMVGNYVEDPATLPPPDIVTSLPDDGVLHAHLLPNPQGRSEMVRVTVIAAAGDGQWVGATTISKFVPQGAQKKKDDEQEFTETLTRGKGRA
jgi:ketosteroid isomerase-like protein